MLEQRNAYWVRADQLKLKISAKSALQRESFTKEAVRVDITKLLLKELYYFSQKKQLLAINVFKLSNHLWTSAILCLAES